ncbi:hypothetical protein HY768_05385, partial [candidate division TA06 bacterium]|nr:hypothetical protein [candidate division TA06 bacterium]
MLPVQKMIGGSVGKLGETFSVQIRLIDLRTARVEKTATQDCNQKMDYLLTDEMKFIANDISGKIVPLGGGSDGNQPIKQNIVYRYQLGVFSIGRLDKFSNGIRNEIEIPDSIKNQLSNGAWGWFGLIVPGGTFYPAHKPLHGLIFLAAEGALIYWANTDGSSPESPGLLFLELHLGQWIWGMVELGKYNKKILGKNYKLAFNVYPEEVNIKTAIVLNF